MRMNEAFPGKYLVAADIKQPRAVVITRVEKQDVSAGSDAPDHKPVVYFQEQEKGLVLNQTNFQTLVDLHGDESDDWAGRQCELYQDTTKFKGAVVPCVRIRAAKTDNADARLQREADAAGADPLQ